VYSNSKIQYWGSIFAAATVASQFHMSLFHEFSMVFFASNIVAGVIFANTRNLWAVFVFHTVFSLYILTVLGL
jgi:membrane protease YdiL (CAAX protease family)